MPTSVVEIERKYDVGPATEVPDLTGLPGVHRVTSEVFELSATYFDTEDLRLRGHAITLRQRQGGSDQGWHLKLPYGADREELHVAGDDPAEGVPEQLHALVRARTRTASLAPVATLRTRRTVRHLLAADGRQLAEVADDVVNGLPSGPDAVELVWREWEVELGEGPRALLDAVQERLLAAGATPSGSSSKVGRVLGARPVAAGQAPWWAGRPLTSRKVTAGGVLLAHLAEQVEELTARDPQVRRDQTEAVHRMRVATRRLRSAFSTFRPLLDRAVTDPLREELGWLAEVLGGARDSEVMHARLQELVAAEDPAYVLGPVRQRIDTELTRRYRQAHDAVLLALDSPRYLQLLDRLDALVAEPPLLPLARERARDVLPGLVRRSWKRLDKAMRTAEDATGQEQDLLLHEARKDAKRARYAAEGVASVYGRPAKTYAKAVTTLQEVLGEHQDGVVTRAALLELAEAAQAAGESSFTYGRLHGLEQARAEAAAARWPQVRRTASVRTLRSWLRD